MQQIALEDFKKIGLQQVPAITLRKMNIEVVDKQVPARLALAYLAPPKTIRIRKGMRRRRLSPSCGLGALEYCLEQQLGDRLEPSVDGRYQYTEVGLIKLDQKDGYVARCRFYCGSTLKGRDKSHANFKVTGFLKHDAPRYYVLVALDGDDPFAWIIPTTKLIDEWERIGSTDFEKRPPHEMFRVPEAQWHSKSGCLDVRLTKKNGRYVFDSIEKAGF